MGVQVQQAQKRDPLGAVKTLAPFAATAAGGPGAGAAVGAGISLMDQQKPMGPQAVQTDPGAIQRRMQDMDSSNIKQLADAKMALQQLPQDVQQQYSQPISQAIQLEQQRRQRGAV